MKTVWPLTGALASMLLVACASAPAPASAPGDPRLIRVNPKKPGWPLDVLVEGLSSPDPAIRAQAAWELSAAKDVPDTVHERLSDMILSDPSPDVRAAAAWTCRMSRYDTPPKLVKSSQPLYPERAFQNKIQGTVQLVILIAESGKVSHAEITQSIPELDAAALSCVMGWTFKPAMKGDRPVAAKATAPVTFRIGSPH